jgi:hypothetical protein
MEGICFLLAVNFFYEGIFKFVHLQSYNNWLAFVPILRDFRIIFTYLIPSVEIILSLLLILSKNRVLWLYVSIGAFVIYIAFITLIFQIWILILHPHHAFWGPSSWIQKMILALCLSGLAFSASVYYESMKKKTKILIN